MGHVTDSGVGVGEEVEKRMMWSKAKGEWAGSIVLCMRKTQFSGINYDEIDNKNYNKIIMTKQDYCNCNK